MHLLCIYYAFTIHYLPYTYLIHIYIHTYTHKVPRGKVSQGNLYITLKIRVPQYILYVPYVLYELISFLSFPCF